MDIRMRAHTHTKMGRHAHMMTAWIGSGKWRGKGGDRAEKSLYICSQITTIKKFACSKFLVYTSCMQALR